MRQTQANQPVITGTEEISFTLSHWLHMIICFCSFGFVYPNAFVEGMDLTAIQRGHEGTLYD